MKKILPGQLLFTLSHANVNTQQTKWAPIGDKSPSFWAEKVDHQSRLPDYPQLQVHYGSKT